MQRYIVIALGGGLGALGRYFLSVWAAEHSRVIFPWGTLLINLAGSFVMGILFELFETLAVSPLYRSFFTIGFLGAFTTFSTFSLENVNLLRDGEWRLAFMNITASVALGIGLAMTGMVLVRFLLKGPR